VITRIKIGYKSIIGSIAFVAMLVMVIINVISRYAFGQSFAYTEEIAKIGFTYTVFFGVCDLYEKHALIAISAIVDKLPKQVKNIVIIINFVILGLLNSLLTCLSIRLTINGWNRPTAALRIPYSFIYVAALISFLIMAFDSFKFLYKALKNKNINLS